MNKKFISGLCVGLLSISLVGCSKTSKDDKPSSDKSEPASTESKNSSSNLKDGTYEVDSKNTDKNGYKAKVVLTVKGGKVVKATYIEFNDKGDKKYDKSYNKAMKEKSGSNPQEYEVKLAEQVVKNQTSEIDGVSGATGSTSKAKQLFKQAFDNAKTGKTEKVEIDVKEAE